jgi:hypothetical protein
MQFLTQSGFETGGAAGLVIILVMLFAGGLSIALLVLRIWAYCRIFSKVGYCWAFGLLIIIPLVHFVVPIILGFSKWPIEKQLQQLRVSSQSSNTASQAQQQ